MKAKWGRCPNEKTGGIRNRDRGNAARSRFSQREVNVGARAIVSAARNKSPGQAQSVTNFTTTQGVGHQLVGHQSARCVRCDRALVWIVSHPAAECRSETLPLPFDRPAPAKVHPVTEERKRA